MMGLPLQARYTLIFLSLITIVVGIVSAILLLEFRASSERLSDTSADVMEIELRAQLVERGATLSELLADNLFNPLHDYDIDAIGRLLGTAIGRRDVLHVIVVDERGHLVHDGTDHVDSFGDSIDRPLVLSALESGNLTIEEGTHGLAFAAPIGTGGYRIGVVVLELSMATLRESVNEGREKLDTIARAAVRWTVFSVATLTFGLVGVGLLAAHLLSRSLSRPIRQLAHYATRLGRGEYPDALVTGRRDEIGDLTTAFNEMSANLKRSTDEIRHMAYHDSLTGLPNRLMFRKLLAQAARAARRRGHLVALMVLDLDHFKKINDTLGHMAGDELLNDVSERLKGSLREEDVVAAGADMPDDSAVARLGGDEFTVLLPCIGDPLDAALVARRLIDALSVPFCLHGRSIVIGASIGITIFPSDAEDPDELLKNADLALYHAKNEGRHNYQYYVDSMNTAALHKLELEDELRRALEHDELELHYQPQFAAATGRLLGAEALIRWHHPDRGMVSPAEFIPVAEETGLIVDIGAWVLRQACLEAAGWHRAGHDDLYVAVNVSARQLRRADLLDVVRDALDDSGLPGESLHVELTETALMEDEASVHDVMEALTEIGVDPWLDDFGTGYSSLSYLRRFPIAGLKIDRSFVRDIDSDPGDLAIACAIIAMARSLDLAVTAEGVETEEQAKLLREQRCTRFQGYLFARPMPAGALWDLLPGDRATERASARAG